MLSREEHRQLHLLGDLARRALQKYLKIPTSTLYLTIGGQIVTDQTPNYQLLAGDSVVVTITDTDDVTGELVVPDAGSVTAACSLGDTVEVDPSGTFLTLTAGPVAAIGNSVSVMATVGGVASSAGVGYYDVVAAPASDPTSVALAFGVESAPAPAATAPASGGTAGPFVSARVFDQVRGHFIRAPGPA